MEKQLSQQQLQSISLKKGKLNFMHIIKLIKRLNKSQEE